MKKIISFVAILATVSLITFAPKVADASCRASGSIQAGCYLIEYTNIDCNLLSGIAEMAQLYAEMPCD